MDRLGFTGAGVVLGVGSAAIAVPSLSPASGILLLAVALLVTGRMVRPSMLLAGVALGWLSVATLPQGPRLRGEVAVIGRVTSVPSGRTVQVSVWQAAPLAGPFEPTSGLIVARLPRDVPARLGDAIAFFGTAGPPTHQGPPGAPDPLRNLSRARIRTHVQAAGASLLGGTVRPVRTDVPPLLLALATGDRRTLDPKHTQLLRDTGTAHLLAISGFHVSAVGLLAASTARLALGLVAMARPGGLPTALAWWAGVATAWAFTWSVGAPVSAQRASLFGTVLTLARTTGREASLVEVLGLAAGLVVLADPTAVGTPSFQLSFGAVLGLATWGDALSRLVPPDLPRWLNGLLASIIASVSTTMGTLPAAAWWFQSMSPVGVLANLFAVPWTMFVLGPCALLAVHGPSWLSTLASAVGGPASEALMWALELTRVAPWHPAVGPVGALVATVIYIIPRWPLLSALPLLVALDSPVSEAEVVFLDVGQGQATYIAWPDGRRWLVDGGRPSAGVLSWLRRQGISRLHRVVASHGDADHAGGLLAVIEHVAVDELHLAGTDGLEALRDAALARGIPVVNTEDARLHPPEPVPEERNDASLVLDSWLGPHRVLLPGDLGETAEAQLADWIGSAAILAVGHHGSRTSTSEAWLEAIDPALAVVSVGRFNHYGHPAPEVLQRLEQRGATVLRTDLHGTIRLAWRDGELALWTHRWGQGWRRRDELLPLRLRTP